MSMPHRATREGVSVSSPQQWDRKSQHNQPRPNRHNGSEDEVVFRRARAILNKLTIEKFDSLVNQLLGVGITNENVLRGIILLLFEKALDEPNYSSMYAQVCLRLSQDAPNFEPPDVKTGKPRQPATFIKLLLSKCKNEFENRSRACELAAQSAAKIESIDDSRERHVQEMASNADITSARRKMLGNIKFIGELGKLQLLSEKILHDCIRQLVSKVRNPNPEDVECLCKLLNTVGAQLDHERARPFMDKYFSRMQDMLKENLPSRIKFMIQDVVDLRESDWIPRRITEEDGPKTISEIRIDAFKEQAMKSAGRGRRQAEQSMRALQMQQFGIQGQFPFQEPQRDRGIPSMPGGFQGMTRGDALLPDFLGSKNSDQQQQQQQQQGNQKKNNQHYNQRNRVGQFTRTPKEPGEISLRPAKNFTFNQPQPQSSKQQSGNNNQQVFPTMPNVLVKKKKEGKGKSKPSKQQMQSSSVALLEEYLHGDDLPEAIQCIKEQLTRNYHVTFISIAYNTALEKSEDVHAKLNPLFSQCVKENIFNSDAVLQGTEMILKSLDDLALDIPKIPQYMGHVVARSIADELFSLKEVSPSFYSGEKTNVYIHILTKLTEIWGQERLFAAFHDSKLDILKVMPKDKRTEQEKVTLLREKNLKFLYPFLKVTDVIGEQLVAHFPLDRPAVEEGEVYPGVRAMFKHFKETFSSEIRHDRKFVYEVARGCFKHTAQLTTMKESEDASKEGKEAEKSLMSDLSPLLAQYCKTTEAQVDTLYALQVFCHDNKFPKGMMLRMAMYLYDMDVVEEEAFMSWRDEINDDYPGKGEALIAVNEYLNWMKTAEYDESEESDEEP